MLSQLPEALRPSPLSPGDRPARSPLTAATCHSQLCSLPPWRGEGQARPRHARPAALGPAAAGHMATRRHRSRPAPRGPTRATAWRWALLSPPGGCGAGAGASSKAVRNALFLTRPRVFLQENTETTAVIIWIFEAERDFLR